jgi:hypothetical protein
MLAESGEIVTRHSTYPGNPGSKLARLSASSRKLAAREMSWPLVRPLVRPTVSAAFSASLRWRKLSSVSVRRISGQYRCRAEQVVPDPVAFRQDWLAGEIALGMEHIDRRDGGRVIEIEPSACQRFVEELGAACDDAGWRFPDERRHHVRRYDGQSASLRCSSRLGSTAERS